MSATVDYDCCVIGAGSAGVAAAQAARELGARVVLISDTGPLGGTCILRGCMPAKTLLSSTQRLGEVETAGTLGIQTRAERVDLGAVVSRKNDLVEYFREDRVSEIESFPLLRGRARFAGPDVIDVDGRHVHAARFIIATGSAIDGAAYPCLRPGDYFTSDAALTMTEVPPSLAVIGGGPVGCEFAQYFARLGSSVTLLQDAPELLRNEDADVGRAVRRALEADGVRVVLGADVAGCERAGETMRLTVRTGEETWTLTVARTMLATGRVPITATLGLEHAGVGTTANGGVAVDARLQTANPSVYAAGDVLGRRCLVHVAVTAGRLAARNALGAPPREMDFDRFESHAVYTQPAIAIAGLTERVCRERDIAIRVRRHPFADIGMALVADESSGFIKMIVDESDRIRGVAIVGAEAIELLGEAIAAIDRGMTASELAEMPHLHPTMNEIFARVAEDFAEPPDTTPFSLPPVAASTVSGR